MWQEAGGPPSAAVSSGAPLYRPGLSCRLRSTKTLFIDIAQGSDRPRDGSWLGGPAWRNAMKKVALRKAAIAVPVLACAAMFSFDWSEQAGVSVSIESAQARVGRPLTPVSVAGVARRQARRAAYGPGVVGAGAVAAGAVAAGAVAAGTYYGATAPYYAGGGPYYGGAYSGGPYAYYGAPYQDYKTRNGF